ncbi:MAG: ketopantoate reductase family protein [Campylobacteraceae bacterium]|nr:ketopantoate reductase family protein [Campylobacteraceae bacterium]
MNIIVIGAGGIGAFYGMILHNIGCNVKFVARGKNLEYLKNNKIKLIHPDYAIEDKIETLSIEELLKEKPESTDAIFIATKSMSTKTISKSLSSWVKNAKKTPYYISLQNGVENEDIMAKYYPKEYVIGGLTRLIAAHTISLGLIDSTGEVQTLLGAVYPNENNQKFLQELKRLLDKTPTKTILCEDIRLELWNKLIINNGVNAICALLQEYSGVLIRDEKVSKIIHGLMSEAALASNAIGINLTQMDADKMFELMTNFESIKPSMWVDTEHNRDLELDEICGVVIKNCEKQGLDAPYTRSVSTILEILYEKQRSK